MDREAKITQVREACDVSRSEAEALLTHRNNDPHEAITFFLDSEGTAWLAARRRGAGAAPQQQPADAPGAVPSQGGLKDMIELLKGMGFAEHAAVKALTQAAGKFDTALNALIQAGEASQARTANEASPSPTQCKPCSGAAGTAATPAAGEDEDCTICMETMNRRNGEAVARCNGRGGAHHYFHAQCLGDWVKQCKSQNQTPSCPTCRGALEVHGKRLRRRMEDASLSDQVRSTLEDLAEQVGDADCFSQVDWKTVGIAAAVAIGAMAVVGIIGALSERSTSSRSRRHDDR